MSKEALAVGIIALSTDIHSLPDPPGALQQVYVTTLHDLGLSVYRPGN